MSQPLHSAAVNFLVRLATEDVRIRFSSMLELELAETAFQIALKENRVEEAWTSVLAYLDYVRIDVDQVIEEVPRLMRAYGLASYDAVHAATALRTDPVAIVTTDVGFSALPAANTTIFTDASRVARCRELRARRR